MCKSAAVERILALPACMVCITLLHTHTPQLQDLQSTNGVIHNGVRVSEVLLAHGDRITFGGARSTAVGAAPGPKAPQSIYSFLFVAMCQQKEKDNESSPSNRSRSKLPNGPAVGGVGGACGGGSNVTASAAEGEKGEGEEAPCVPKATRAASKGKGKEAQEPVNSGACAASRAEACLQSSRPKTIAGTSDRHEVVMHDDSAGEGGASDREARQTRTFSTVRAPTLPLQHLRDENGVLDHHLLGPQEPWPTCDTSLTVSLEGEKGTPGLHVGQLSFSATEMPRGMRFNRNKKMRAEFRAVDAWSADGLITQREMLIYYSDDGPDEDPIAIVGARERMSGEHQPFWTLFNLAQLSQPEKAEQWEEVWEEADLPFLDEEGKTMPRVLLHVRMARPEGSVGVDVMPTITIDVALGPAVFLLDRRLSAGTMRGKWIDEEEYENALVGERQSAQARDGFKALRRLLLYMVSCGQATGLRLGPDTCEATMNGYAGVRKADVLGKVPEATGAGGSSRSCSLQPKAADFDLGRLLESISTKGGESRTGVEAETLSADALSGLREDCNLHAFQQDGIAWMVAREENGDWLSLHPCWIQLQTPNRSLIYLHRWTGELTSRFFTAPCLETCGGMLCDDVGLGKTVQLLGLVMARPAPPDFAVKELPIRTNQVQPIKGTLIVAPAALLPQWESEIRKHTKPGALHACTYLGIGGFKKSTSTDRGRGNSEDVKGNLVLLYDFSSIETAGWREEALKWFKAPKPCGMDQPEYNTWRKWNDPKYGRGSNYKGGQIIKRQISNEPSAEVEESVPRTTRRSVRAANATTPHASTPSYEVLARTQRHLFVRAAFSLEDHDADEVKVEQCDIILCSFETLRDELRKTQREHGGMDLSLSLALSLSLSLSLSHTHTHTHAHVHQARPTYRLSQHQDNWGVHPCLDPASPPLHRESRLHPNPRPENLEIHHCLHRLQKSDITNNKCGAFLPID